MRISNIQELINDEFGAAYAQVLLKDLVLPELADRSPNRALADGLEPREVWLAICRAENVPESRWHGLNKIAKKRHAED